MANELVALKATADLLSAANSISGLLSYRDISKIEREARRDMAQIKANLELAVYESYALEEVALTNIINYERVSDYTKTLNRSESDMSMANEQLKILQRKQAELLNKF